MGRQSREPLPLRAEIMRRIRAMAGEDFIIGLAVNLHPEVEASLSIEAAAGDHRLARRAAARWTMSPAAPAAISTSPDIIPNVFFADKLGAPYAEALKAVTTHMKVQAESHIRTPENAEYVVASGQADMVSIVRGQIADPHLANKAQDGPAEDIRPCLSCNQMCWGRRFRDYWISCLINPSAGREFEWGGDRFTPRRAAQAGSGGRRRRRRAGGGAGRGRARPSGDAGRGVGPARRAVPPRRHAAAPPADPRLSSTGRSAS